MKRLVATVATVAIIAALLLPALASAAGNTVTVAVSVQPRTQITTSGDELVVRANTTWRATIVTNESTIEYTGDKTNGDRLEMPDGTTDYWVVAE